MKLKGEQSLQYSSTVANNKMNRQRQLTGINSYENDLQYNLLAYLQRRLATQKNVYWLDVCCGEGRALLQGSQLFQEEIANNRLKIIGLDLVDYFHPDLRLAIGIDIEVSPINNWQTDLEFDLITVVHGFHYFGDKLTTLSKLSLLLKKEGLLIANFDANSIEISSPRQKVFSIKKALQLQGIDYNHSMKILRCEGQRALDFSLTFIGAKDKGYTTYTGMEGVKAYYELL